MSFGPPPAPYTASVLDARRRNRRRRGLVLGTVALLAAAVTVAVWTLAAGGETPADRRPAAARQDPDDIRETVETRPRTPDSVGVLLVRKTIRTVGQNVPAAGTWATGTTFAKGYGNRVEGYRLGAPAAEDGNDASREAWHITFPAAPCAVTQHVSVDGRTAVVHPGRAPGKNADETDLLDLPCDRLTVFDVDTGKRLWTVKLPGDGSAMNANVTMADGAVAVSWGTGSAAYDMTGGKRLWADPTPSACTDLGFGGGRELVALQTCGESADPTYRVQKVNPRTGKALWTYKVAPGVNEVFVVSSSPAVVAVAAGDYQVTDLIALSDTGRARGTIRIDRDHQAVRCDGTFNAAVEACRGIVVGQEQAYISTNGEVVAYDLDTGNTVFKFDSPDGRETHPLRMSGGKVVAYRKGSSFGPDSIVSLDPATRRQTALLYFSGGHELLDVNDPVHSDDVLYEQGRVFFAARGVTGPADKGEVGGSEVLAVGIESVG
ncbi:PQQ-binding-like beta-propeller repeat protein [Streptomyces sp. DH24]|uniref:outer membrane protein assembly factor BamB family protein n=1 Tax=Streptomyces sp. DH24 TaxID=3040123 RepID=UPI0024436AAC|nr:PQQ-binding-like beta-propeller repeat protein [Streptomyces sp. DH24]MDG9720071.1 PQQ-binding-like beta-propeller repeat protein [Streptomyces sp. DH24]